MLNQTHYQTYLPGFEVPFIFILVIQYEKIELISIVLPRYSGGLVWGFLGGGGVVCACNIH